MLKPVIHRPAGTGATMRLGPTEYLTDKAIAADTGGHYTLFELTSGKGGSVPFHEHDWDEAFYVLDGQYVISFLDDAGEIQNVTAGPAAFVHIPGGQPHAYRNAGDGYSRMLVINQPVGIEPIVRTVGLECAGPGIEPDAEAVPAEKLEAAFQSGGIRVRADLLERSRAGAWKDAK